MFNMFTTKAFYVLISCVVIVQSLEDVTIAQDQDQDLSAEAYSEGECPKTYKPYPNTNFTWVRNKEFISYLTFRNLKQ